MPEQGAEAEVKRSSEGLLWVQASVMGLYDGTI
jgi:hypothetical protein